MGTPFSPQATGFSLQVGFTTIQAFTAGEGGFTTFETFPLGPGPLSSCQSSNAALSQVSEDPTDSWPESAYPTSYLSPTTEGASFTPGAAASTAISETNDEGSTWPFESWSSAAASSSTSAISSFASSAVGSTSSSVLSTLTTEPSTARISTLFETTSFIQPASTSSASEVSTSTANGQNEGSLSTTQLAMVCLWPILAVIAAIGIALWLLRKRRRCRRPRITSISQRRTRLRRVVGPESGMGNEAIATDSMTYRDNFPQTAELRDPQILGYPTPSDLHSSRDPREEDLPRYPLPSILRSEGR